jgi:hypothetical protein
MAAAKKTKKATRAVTTKKAAAKKASTAATKKAGTATTKKAGTATAKDTAKGKTHARGLDGKTIRIRMYRVGFGDCFLLSLPLAKGAQASGYRHVLIDCGVHATGDIGTMAEVVKDIAAETNQQLAAVIATHAHQDHISGFGKFADDFSRFSINEVWLPWAMDTSKNSLAAKFQLNQAALTDALTQHFQALAATGAKVSPEAKAALENLTGIPLDSNVPPEVARQKGNAKALGLLRAGFGVKAKVKYLEAGNQLEDPADIPGLSVRVLGPPTGQTFLSQMNPPKGHHFLRLNSDGEVEPVGKPPFPSKWLIPPERFAQDTANFRELGFSTDAAEFLKQIAGAPLDDLAFALDQVMNNTSLVTLFIFRGHHLLFPGDAQWGNWRNFLVNESADDILPLIDFFKVAHHGSINATPPEIIDKMSTGKMGEGKFGAMVSTEINTFNKVPLPALLTAIDTKSKQRIVRSDWVKAGTGSDPNAYKTQTPAKPARLPDGFKAGDFWIDYLIEI